MYGAKLNYIQGKKIMMKEVEGDILLSKSQALAHGVSIDDDFKSGLSLQLKVQWPALFKDFRTFCSSQSPKVGDVWSWQAPGTPLIFNLITQDAIRPDEKTPSKASIPNLQLALRNLVKELQRKKINSLAITKIDTGLGGLDWKDVKVALQSDLSHYEGQISVYANYKSRVVAKE